MTRGKILESEIQRVICDYLAYTGVFFWRTNNIPAVYSAKDGSRRFRSLPKYTPRGLPDIICIKNSHFIALEVKREGCKQTPDQLLIQQNIEDNGGYYYVIYGIEDLKKIVFFKFK